MGVAAVRSGRPKRPSEHAEALAEALHRTTYFSSWRAITMRWIWLVPS